MVAILHNIRSLYNVGSMFRTADGAGIEKLYLCGVTPTPLDPFGRVRPQVAKVALGAEKTVPWEHARSTTSVIKKLKKDGYKIFAVERAKNSVPYSKITSIQRSYNGRAVLVFGNEVRGLPPSLLRLADTILEIPMHGKKESLNVSVAFGIIAYAMRYNK